MSEKSRPRRARTSRGAAKKDAFSAYRQGTMTPEVMLTVRIVLAARLWRSLLDERLRPIEQSSARMETMGAILNLPPNSSQADIAKRLRIEGPTVTRMLDVLERDGLVQRVPDPADRRTNQLRLTTDGEAALGDIFEIVDTLRARLLDGLPGKTIDQLNTLFADLIVRLDAGLPPD